MNHDRTHEAVTEWALLIYLGARRLGIAFGRIFARQRTDVYDVHRTGWDAEGEPVEWTTSKFRGDRFRFVSRQRLDWSAPDAGGGFHLDAVGPEDAAGPVR